MADFLYVCEFSNGHIKVGRSINAAARIAQHQERVSCMGVELMRRDAELCLGDSHAAESQLIERCSRAAAERFKNEWFVGLEFVHVLRWMKEAAREDWAKVLPPLAAAVLAFGGATKLAATLGHGCVRQHVEHWIKGKGIPPEHCHTLSALTGLTLQQLRPDDWARIWPQAAEGV